LLAFVILTTNLINFHGALLASYLYKLVRFAMVGDYSEALAY